MDSLWFMNVESVVFDRVKKASKDYLSKYSDLTFTSQEMSLTNPKFPCVEIRELEGIEAANTLDNRDVAAYMSTFQVNVYSESSKSIARDVMSEIMRCFKEELQFNLVAMPVHANVGDVHRYSARCRRMIGAGDGLVK